MKNTVLVVGNGTLNNVYKTLCLLITYSEKERDILLEHLYGTVSKKKYQVKKYIS